MAAPEHLIPASTDEDGEQLPDEFHISYPFGNPYARARTTAPYVTEPKLSPRLHMNLALASVSARKAQNGGRARPEGELSSGAAALASQASQATNTLPAHLTLRAKTQHVARTPDWPFKKFGPGKGGHTSLLRAELNYPSQAYRDVWTDLALDRFLPRDAVDGAPIPDADPLHGGRIGEGAGLPGMDTGPSAAGGAGRYTEDLPVEVKALVDSLGPHGVDQFPTGLSGAFAYVVGEAEKDAEAAYDVQVANELKNWLAKRRDAAAAVPGDKMRFEWGKGFVPADK